MSYEFNSDADQVITILESIAKHSQAVSEDAIPFIKTYYMLQENEQAQLATKVPQEYVHQTNTNFGVLRWGFVGEKVLQSMGAPLVIVGPEGDRDKRIKAADQVAIYTVKDTPSVLSAMINPPAGDREAGFDLLSTTGMDSFPLTAYFDSVNRTSWVNNKELTPIKDTGLLESAFMTLVLKDVRRELLKAQMPTGRNDDPLAITSGFSGIFFETERAKSYALYQKLVNKGFRPLGFEEVYGLMANAIQSFVKRHPEYDPKAKQADQNGEIL